MGRKSGFYFTGFFVLLLTAAAPAQTFTTIDPPDLAGFATANGISGNTIVGSYQGSTPTGSEQRAFIYNGSTWTPLVHPSASQTGALAVSGSLLVGNYLPTSDTLYHGYKYNGTSFTDVIYPGAGATQASGVDGNKIVGKYLLNGNESYGYVYDGTTYTTIDHPSAVHDFGFGTEVSGISGNKMVGRYYTGSHFEAFLYDGTDYLNFTHPNGPTTVMDIDGDNVVGYYTNFMTGIEHGFVHYGNAWIDIDDPLGVHGTYVNGIDGDRVVGSYLDENFHSHAFVATIPEPSGMLFITAAGLIFGATRRSTRF